MDKKKKNKKIIIIVVVVAAVVLLIGGGVAVVSSISKGMKEAMSMLEGENDDLFEVKKEDVKQEISTSGVVVGIETDAYISPVTAQVKDICVEVGQTVKKGDVLLVYDDSELGTNLEKVKIQAAADRAMGNESYEVASEAASKVSSAKKKSKELKEDIKKLKKDVEKLTDKVADYDEKIAAGDESVNQKDYKKAASDLKKKSEALATKEGKLAEQEGVIAANKDVKVSASTKAQVSASNQLNNMNINDAQESLDAAKAGLVAKKDGIVSSVDVVKGAYANETQSVMTVIDSDKIGVEFTIPKDDLGAISKGQKVRVVISGHEYSGTVDFVSRMSSSESFTANNGGNGAGGSIKGRVLLDNPDENIFIGVSAKVFIFVGEEKQTLVIPFESLNMDIDGDFVYVVNSENLIERKAVTVGIYSDEYYQVIDGLEEGDKVIRNVTIDMKPGDEYVGNAMTGMALPE